MRSWRDGEIKKKIWTNLCWLLINYTWAQVIHNIVLVGCIHNTLHSARSHILHSTCPLVVLRAACARSLSVPLLCDAYMCALCALARSRRIRTFELFIGTAVVCVLLFSRCYFIVGWRCWWANEDVDTLQFANTHIGISHTLIVIRCAHICIAVSFVCDLYRVSRINFTACTHKLWLISRTREILFFFFIFFILYSPAHYLHSAHHRRWLPLICSDVYL